MSKEILGALIISLALFCFAGFVYPEIGDTLDIKDQLSLEKTTLSAMELGKQNIETLKKQLNERANDVSRVSLFLPEDKQVEFVITSVEQASIESGMSLASIKVGEQSKSKDDLYSTMLVDLELDGTYNSFFILLDRLEQSLRIYDIMNFNIAPDDDSAGVFIKINLSLQTYVLNQND